MLGIVPPDRDPILAGALKNFRVGPPCGLVCVGNKHAGACSWDHIRQQGFKMTSQNLGRRCFVAPLKMLEGIQHGAEAQQHTQIVQRAGGGGQNSAYGRRKVGRILESQPKCSGIRLGHDSNAVRINQVGKSRSADSNLVALPQNVFGHRCAIHEGAVPAFQIPQSAVLSVAANDEVAAGHGVLFQAQIIREVSSHREFTARQRKYGALVGPRSATSRGASIFDI